ncbi:MAG: DUF1800 domain-containing protein [Burkholderiales bacterium]|nr:DUF1800 domain-containing protein [Burkholderiales bacterium]
MPYDESVSHSRPATLTAGLGLLGALSACGKETTPPVGIENKPLAAPPALASISEQDAARFLMQASLGATRDEIARVQMMGYEAWLDAQFAQPATATRWDWLISKGMDDPAFHNSQAGFDSCAWRKLISSPDTLRQRITLALSEIIVVSINGLVQGGGWRAFCAAYYLDLLEANCFGNYRDLLYKVSRSVPMSLYLTYRGNSKANLVTGAMPDENYAREIMQLFSIGLLKLNLDGSVVTSNGAPVETYTNDDITGLARIFTGWDLDLSGSNTSTPDYHRRPLTQIASRHETGASQFLGQTIPAGISAEQALSMSIDVIFAHPNVAPFISRQLIQRLVTSNPSPAYISRVATVFNNNGAGVKGDLKAVVKAVLLDSEARTTPSSASTQTGKIREPLLRFLAWARAFKANSATDTWKLGDTTDASTKLGQSPLRSPTVFNFFRPGYVPPNTSIARANLLAPEMQIVNETSVVGYVNFMQSAVNGSKGVGDLAADYNNLLAFGENSNAVVDEIHLLLAAGQISTDNLALIKQAISSMPATTDRQKLSRIYAALTLVLASPEFIVFK